MREIMGASGNLHIRAYIYLDATLRLEQTLKSQPVIIIITLRLKP
jgi:hypothetical protein